MAGIGGQGGVKERARRAGVRERAGTTHAPRLCQRSDLIPRAGVVLGGL